MEHGSVNISSILPKFSYVKGEVAVKEWGNKLEVYYLNRYHNGKLKTKRFQPKEALVPKRIKISPLLIEGCGLYQGDGQKSINSKSYQVLKFSNSNLHLILYFLNFLNRIFGIKPTSLKGHIILGSALKNKITEQEAIKYWSGNTGIPSSAFYKVYWNKNKYLDSKAEPYGNLSLIYSNSSFRVVFDSVFNYIKTQSLSDDRFAASFLRGLIAADGNVYYDQDSHRELSIAAKENVDREYIRKLFCLVRVHPNKDNLTKNKETIRITGISNFEIIRKYDLCSLHPDKKQKFEKLFSSYKTICYKKGWCVSLMLGILKEGPKTVYNLADKLQRKPNAIRRYLKILHSQNEVKMVPGDRVYATGRVAEKWILV